MGMKNILIVDNNLGFVYWLGEALAAANCQPWPASSAAEASALVRNRRLTQLDLLILNPALRGATQLIARLRRTRPDLKVLAVDPMHDRQVRTVDAWHARPSRGDRTERLEWMREVERFVGRHKRAA